MEAPRMSYDRADLDDQQLIELYRRMLRPRMIEEKMLKLLRQGRISKWFSGIGQEAIAVSAASALNQEEFIFPMHRNLGVFTTREVPLQRLFAQFQGKAEGFTKGRDRSFHFGAPEYHIVGMISHLGPQLALAGGVGLAEKLEQRQALSLVFSGEGGTSEGDFHEALNVAAVWDLPVIFLIENNGYGLSTPTNEQFRCEQLAQRGAGYGMESHTIDGNNILETYVFLRNLAQSIRENPRPVLVECMTFRMRGHEEASGTKYVPQDLMDFWAQKDPISNYQNFLFEQGILNDDMLNEMRSVISQEIEQGLEIAFNQAAVEADQSRELGDIYVPYESAFDETVSGGKSMRFVDAVSEGLRMGMEKHPQSVLMGQDVAEYGGVFKITEGFIDQFGKDRIRNTPICESAIVGIGLGMALKGWKSVIEMQFADFVSCAFNQIVNNLAKIHYRWGQAADVVIRMPSGAGVGAGPFHSQSNEAWFYHVPGLKLVYPSNPKDAKGLLLAAMADPNPVLFFEHKALYRSLTGEVPDEYYETPIGKAAWVQEGSDISIITYGMGVHWAKEAQEANPDTSLDILDLRSLMPWDKESVQASVERTGKVIVLHEDTLQGGIGAEISAWINEHCFEKLDAPVLRVASLDTPVPFAADLEKDFLPQQRLQQALSSLEAY
jgi:2-oxoisovalerate dehydrogenase E1 component